MSIKSKITSYIKNFKGWKSSRKLLAFAVDDYGNIGLSSPQAKEKLREKGVTLKGRFNQFDALDTKQDYEQLFAVLQSVQDKNNNSAVFTTYAMPANVDFQNTFRQGVFILENLDVTYASLSQEDPESFAGAFELLQNGIESGLIKPQFHGREHLNVLLFNRLLKDNNPSLLANLELNSLVGIPNHRELPNVRFNEAFSFWKKEEIELHKAILEDGINRFERVYGYRPITFTPPAMLLHPDLYTFAESLGIKAIDKPRSHQVHLGEGTYQSEKNKLGIEKGHNHVTIVRNCMFEPNSRNIDWVNFTFNQIKAAFFWSTPAIISSHRVNYCGHIDPENRRRGLELLKALLTKVVRTWPDVEFISVDQLVEDVIKSNR